MQKYIPNTDSSAEKYYSSYLQNMRLCICMYAHILFCYFFEIKAMRHSSLINYPQNLVKKEKNLESVSGFRPPSLAQELFPTP